MHFTTRSMKAMLRPDYDWNEWHTKQLLDMRQYYRAYFENTPRDIRETALFDLLQKRIREVLATREHVLNKLERKAARQAKAKAQRNR